MLGMMGRLDEMRKEGYRAFVIGLAAAGRRLDFTDIFLFSEQPRLEALEEELARVAAEHGERREAAERASDSAAALRRTLDPLWFRAEEALRSVSPEDLAQVAGYRRPPAAVRAVAACVAAMLDIPAAIAEWDRLRRVLGDSGTAERLLAYDRARGSSMQATRRLNLLARGDGAAAGDPAALTERTVPNSDPGARGSALVACAAYAAAVAAVQAHNALRQETGPLLLEAKAAADAMERLRPRLEGLMQAVAEQRSQLARLRRAALERAEEILSAVLDYEEEEALVRLQEILVMDSPLTARQVNDRVITKSIASHIFSRG